MISIIYIFLQNIHNVGNIEKSEQFTGQPTALLLSSVSDSNNYPHGFIIGICSDLSYFFLHCLGDLRSSNISGITCEFSSVSIFSFGFVSAGYAT